MWFFVIALVALAIGFALAPRPQTQQNNTAGDIQAPTAEEGASIPVLFGTRDITGPNIVWYGDVRVEAIRKSGGKK